MHQDLLTAWLKIHGQTVFRAKATPKNSMVLNNEDVDVRRAEARRARDQERVKKLHDGRLRNIGVRPCCCFAFLMDLE